MSLYEQWKKGFDVWEARTAELLENAMRSNSLLAPIGKMMSFGTRMKTASDKATAMFWSQMGLPNRRDQERTLHALNQLNSRLLDLEEKLTHFEAKPKHAKK